MVRLYQATSRSWALYFVVLSVGVATGAQEPRLDILRGVQGESACDLKQALENCSLAKRDLREPSSLLIARAVTDPPPATLCTCNVPYFNVWSACVFTSSSQNITLPVWSTLQTSCTSGGIDLARSAALVSDHASLGMKLPSWSAVPLPQSGSSDLWFDMQRVVQIASPPEPPRWTVFQVIAPIISFLAGGLFFFLLSVLFRNVCRPRGIGFKRLRSAPKVKPIDGGMAVGKDWAISDDMPEFTGSASRSASRMNGSIMTEVPMYDSESWSPKASLRPSRKESSSEPEPSYGERSFKDRFGDWVGGVAELMKAPFSRRPVRIHPSNPGREFRVDGADQYSKVSDFADLTHSTKTARIPLITRKGSDSTHQPPIVVNPSQPRVQVSRNFLDMGDDDDPIPKPTQRAGQTAESQRATLASSPPDFGDRVGRSNSVNSDIAIVSPTATDLTHRSPNTLSLATHASSLASPPVLRPNRAGSPNPRPPALLNTDFGQSDTSMNYPPTAGWDFPSPGPTPHFRQPHFVHMARTVSHPPELTDPFNAHHRGHSTDTMY